MLWRRVTSCVVALAMATTSVVGGTVFCPDDVTPWDFSAESGGVPGLPDDLASATATPCDCQEALRFRPVFGLECTLALVLPEPESACALAPPTPPPIAA